MFDEWFDCDAAVEFVILTSMSVILSRERNSPNVSEFMIIISNMIRKLRTCVNVSVALIA